MTDKRLLAFQGELAFVFKAMEREGNTLSPVKRDLWDHGRASTLTRHEPLTATNAHVSVIAHITPTELRRSLTATEMANGLANRYLFALVQRSKLLPLGGDPPAFELDRLAQRLTDALTSAKQRRTLGMDAAARHAWIAVYPTLDQRSDDLLSAVLGRAAPQVRRMAVIFALIDNKPIVGLAHLRGALALWDYCAASAAYVFGGKVGDPLADELLTILQRAGATGRTRTEIREAVGTGRSKEAIDLALAALAGRGLAEMEREETGQPGRPTERWTQSRSKSRSSEEKPFSFTKGAFSSPMAAADSAGQTGGCAVHLEPTAGCRYCAQEVRR